MFVHIELLVLNAVLVNEFVVLIVATEFERLRLIDQFEYSLKSVIDIVSTLNQFLFEKSKARLMMIEIVILHQIVAVLVVSQVVIVLGVPQAAIVSIAPQIVVVSVVSQVVVVSVVPQVVPRVVAEIVSSQPHCLML